jgi:hypothetical protein
MTVNKLLLSSLLLFASLLVSGCGIDFATRYDRIEDNKVRPLAFVYDNHGYAEAAPGDTVTCTAYFAGDTVRTIDWTVSTALIIGSFGSDTFADTVSLDRYLVPGSYQEYFGGTTDSVRFEFIVPADIIRDNFSDNGTVADLLPAGISDSLMPESVRVMSPASLIDMVELLSGGASAGIPDSVLTGVLSDSVVQMIPALLQAFTVEMKLFARVNGTYRVESTFTVRYNTRLHPLIPEIPVNRNPVVTWIRCYRVTGDPVVFDPVTDKKIVDTLFNLFPEPDTIVIEPGFHYFLVADSATGSLDSAVSLTDQSLQARPEELSYEWFFENCDEVSSSLDSQMLLDNAFRGPSVTLLPSLDVRMRNFTLWLVTYDSFLGEKLRPVGFSFRSVQGTFRYSDSYIQQHKN